jgi:thioredoxin 1
MPVIPASSPASQPASQPVDGAQTALPMPRLVELGGSRCMVCQQMKPIIDELRRDYTGHFRVETVDVFEDRETADRFGVRVIPTQIFIDSQGKELFRHEGFMAREAILAMWKRLGVDVAATAGG